MKKNRKKGFTLIELMVVVIIVGILAAIAIPLYTGQVKKSKASEGASLVGSIRTAERVYYSQHNEYKVIEDAVSSDEDLGVDASGNKYFTTFSVDGTYAVAYGSGDAADIQVRIKLDDGTLEWSTDGGESWKVF
ncbi:MAG TPA: prepilin-type N-terminal cleavage/methylation domain-containing protein [bacterium]|nr:prepilin-type N-terminal cleavage/methylation domain-containing protein [bacterium]HOM27680.1 prepilin-type N-terminal cleavage/methylation domain-containing protein [bacterium]